jgi:hypothetical protein
MATSESGVKRHKKQRNNKKRPPPKDAQTLSIPEAGRKYFGLGKNASYDAAKRGLIPFIDVSPKIRRVPIRAMERLLDTLTKPAA